MDFTSKVTAEDMKDLQEVANGIAAMPVEKVFITVTLAAKALMKDRVGKIKNADDVNTVSMEILLLLGCVNHIAGNISDTLRTIGESYIRGIVTGQKIEEAQKDILKNFTPTGEGN